MVGTIMGIRILTNDDISRALEALDRVAETYSKSKVDIVNLGGSPPVILGGVGSAERLIERMERASGTRATTSQTGAIAALKTLGVTKVALASPFNKTQNEKLKAYLEAHGLKVGAMEGLDLSMEGMASSPIERSYRLAREVVRRAEEEVNGIYIPCAQWPTVEKIEVLEKDTSLPVVTSVQAMLWHCLRKLGLRETIEGYGRLFEVETIKET
jgi:maleate cis-trans isomerase